MKKVLTLCIFVLATLSLASCGSNNTANTTTPTTTGAGTTVETSATSNVQNEKVTIADENAQAEVDGVLEGLLQ